MFLGTSVKKPLDWVPIQPLTCDSLCVGRKCTTLRQLPYRTLSSTIIIALISITLQQLAEKILNGAKPESMPLHGIVYIDRRGGLWAD
jgi:hypothetical protein